MPKICKYFGDWANRGNMRNIKKKGSNLFINGEIIAQNFTLMINYFPKIFFTLDLNWFPRSNSFLNMPKLVAPGEKTTI